MNKGSSINVGINIGYYHKESTCAVTSIYPSSLISLIRKRQLNSVVLALMFCSSYQNDNITFTYRGNEGITSLLQNALIYSPTCNHLSSDWSHISKCPFKCFPKRHHKCWRLLASSYFLHKEKFKNQNSRCSQVYTVLFLKKTIQVMVTGKLRHE